MPRQLGPTSIRLRRPLRGDGRRSRDRTGGGNARILTAAAPRLYANPALRGNRTLLSCVLSGSELTGAASSVSPPAIARPPAAPSTAASSATAPVPARAPATGVRRSTANVPRHRPSQRPATTGLASTARHRRSRRRPSTALPAARSSRLHPSRRRGPRCRALATRPLDLRRRTALFSPPAPSTTTCGSGTLRAPSPGQCKARSPPGLRRLRRPFGKSSTCDMTRLGETSQHRGFLRQVEEPTRRRGCGPPLPRQAVPRRRPAPRLVGRARGAHHQPHLCARRDRDQPRQAGGHEDHRSVGLDGQPKHHPQVGLAHLHGQSTRPPSGVCAGHRHPAGALAEGGQAPGHRAPGGVPRLHRCVGQPRQPNLLADYAQDAALTSGHRRRRVGP
ncbi:translation initiation factor IF-2-like isoform X1 [Panicum virgatum]|uniref:Uncharacterized protein n=1 Tax=Panicum virgatum TaxID=38727 RepID=A0A8T0WQG6_PANVG|nr:translation initiation factor IF-2-like isoform X1 [Panicum virgatum]XP_039789864.1 translation initiation factor IF-2-like isoform X1 [Panicum virgatum]KAG2651362.1 hypothetical protein PVAP13_1NG359157 [Panicum virgatum]